MDQALEAAIAARLDAIDRDSIVERIWAGDHTVWSDHPEEVSDRLGWLRVQRHIQARVPEFEMLRQDVVAEGFTTAVLLGMGGSSLAPEVMYESFGQREGGLRLIVLDSTDPRQLVATEAVLDLERTLFIVSSKSGSTVETLSHLAYFWEKRPDGRHFIAITDYGTGLERIARDRDFRAVFINPPDIGGRYSALSCFGTRAGSPLQDRRVGPLLGADSHVFCGQVAARLNPGAAAPSSRSAVHGRDKLTRLPPKIRTSRPESNWCGASWKPRRRTAPPAAYGAERRLFVTLDGHPSGWHGSRRATQSSIPFEGPVSLGAEFWRWGVRNRHRLLRLGVNPFDQPNVRAAKEATAVVLAGGGGDPPRRSARCSRRNPARNFTRHRLSPPELQRCLEPPAGIAAPSASRFPRGPPPLGSLTLPPLDRPVAQRRPK